jgi:hypothetical protein
MLPPDRIRYDTQLRYHYLSPDGELENITFVVKGTVLQELALPEERR